MKCSLSFQKTFSGLLAMSFAGMVAAQVPVLVQDQDGRARPDAHVQWQPLGPGQGGMIVTDAAGRAVLPLGDADLLHGVVLRISHVGMTVIQDTLVRRPVEAYRLRPTAVSIPEMVVTGQYGPVAADNAVHKVRVIGAEQLDRLAANDLSDALRNELNIRLSQDNVFGTNISMQGLGDENVKILIDGIPVIGRQDGKLDLTQIDLNGIDRIEVVEGPLSVSYGTNALAGTINLITRKAARKEPDVRLSSYAEHIGRLNLWGAFSKRWGRHNLNLNVGRDFFAGWTPGQKGIPDFAPAVADTNRWQAWKPREQYNVRVNHRWTGDRWHLGYKGEFSDDVITARGMPRLPFYEVAFDDRFRTERLDNAVFADRYWEKGRKLTMLAAHDRYTRTSNSWRRDLTDLGATLLEAPGSQDTSLFTLTNVRVVYASAADSAKLRYEFGADLNHETANGDRIGETNSERIGDYALYTSLEYSPVSKLVVRPALRFAYNTVYGAPLVPSFNLRWQLAPDYTFRASYARGFRAPSLKELHLFFVDVNHNIRGNTDLSAEHSNNFGSSVSWRKTRAKGTFRAELSGFYNDIEDLITLAQVDGTLYSYINIGRYRTAGGSVGAGWENERWSVTLGGNLTGRQDDLARQSAEPFLWWNEARVNLGYTAKKAGLLAQVFFKHQGEMQNYLYMADGTVGRGRMQAFQVADASVTKRIFADRFGLTIGCKNIFDVQNLTTTAVSSGVHSGGGTSVPMMTGRLWFVRLAIQLKGKEE